jgi:dCTP deaminase
MYLSDIDIKKAVEKGHIRIDDFDEARLQPASYDVLLGNKFEFIDPHTIEAIDPREKKFPGSKKVEISDEETFVLHPGVSVLGTLKDFVGSKEFLIQISGKSSLARIGLIIHNTAGIINPGHFLNVTLELYNLNRVPIVLRPGMEIAQLTFSMLSTSPVHDYAEKGRFNEDNWNNFATKKN